MNTSFRLRLGAILLASSSFIMSFHGLSTSVQAQSETSDKENDPLTTYRGKDRVVLVFAPTESDPQLVRQLGVLKNKAELADRQLIVLPVLADDKAAGKSLPFLQNKFNEGKATFSVVLVGKDGTAAFRTGEPVTAEAIYAKIDAMPMRKQEVKEKTADSGKESGVSKKTPPEEN